MSIYEIKVRIELQKDEPLNWFDNLLDKECGDELWAYQIEKIIDVHPDNEHRKVVWKMKKENKLKSIY
jgi:hypothetical protein